MTEDSEVPEGDICLRQANASDKEFLFEVYASTRENELAVLDWSSDQKQAFFRQQFLAQAQSYKAQFPNADLQIVLRDNNPIGRLYVDRGEVEIRLVDIALLPQHRNVGIGSALLNDLLSEARLTGKPVRLHVETSNRARRLYERLGFTVLEERGIYQFLEWRPTRR